MSVVQKTSSQSGYVAISTVLVVLALFVMVGTSVSMLALTGLQSVFSQVRSDEGLHQVEACVEDALLRLNENNTLPASFSIEGQTCSITVNSSGSGVWTFTVSYTTEVGLKRVQVTATRGTTVTISSWKELD